MTIEKKSRKRYRFVSLAKLQAALGAPPDDVKQPKVSPSEMSPPCGHNAPEMSAPQSRKEHTS